jgi:hypothetical protein
MKTLTVDTADYSRYFIAVDTAAKCGISYKSEERLDCCKRYHAELTAETPEQEKILNMISGAAFAHPQEKKRRHELNEYLNNLTK